MDVEDVSCRICWLEDHPDEMMSPCDCSGSMAFVHFDCQSKFMLSRRVAPNRCPTCLTIYKTLECVLEQVSPPPFLEFLKSLSRLSPAKRRIAFVIKVLTMIELGISSFWWRSRGNMCRDCGRRTRGIRQVFDHRRPMTIIEFITIQITSTGEHVRELFRLEHVHISVLVLVLMPDLFYFTCYWLFKYFSFEYLNYSPLFLIILFTVFNEGATRHYWSFPYHSNIFPAN